MNDGSFRCIAGNLALDFVNTVHRRVSRRQGGRDYLDRVVGERLERYPDLLRWAGVAGVGGSRGRRAPGLASSRPGRDLALAIRFREALYRVFKARIEGWRPRPLDLGLIERTLQSVRRRQRLISETDGIRWRSPPSRGVTGLLIPIALEAEALLTSLEMERVRQCTGERCGWLFLDRTRNRSRRWCSMDDCGNLDKVRRFRNRARRRKGSKHRRGRPARPVA
jgi:predicted RNA-binding Zn ribbon-like protein